jgi:hypothetical protein
MTHSRKFFALACCVTASAVLAGQASARLISHESFHDERTSVVKKFCGVAHLTVSVASVIDGRMSAVSHGPDGLVYSLNNVKESGTVTNLADGNFVTFAGTDSGKDLKVTDNGDGTLTILTRSVGNDVWYGPDGTVIARNPGQSRFELLVDDGGTPTDPSDDEVISAERVKGSTGRNDDFCAAMVAELS